MASGGILALDTFYLAPHVSEQRARTLREQAARAASAGRTAMTSEKARLRASCSAWARNADALTVLDPNASSRRFVMFIEAELTNVRADMAWATDAHGRITALWIRRDHAGLAVGTTALRALLEGLGPDLYTAHPLPETGLVKLDSHIAVFARATIASTSLPQPASIAEGNLWAASILNADTMERMGSTMGGKLVLVGSDTVPTSATQDDSTTHAWWSHGEDTIVVSWPAQDAAGAPLACFRAELPVGQINRQASASRQMVLIVLWLSVAMVLLVIVAVHIFIAGPVVRLLSKLQTIDSDEGAFHDLAHNLHGEPRVLARRLESAFDRLAHMSKTDELTGMANRRHFEEVLDCFYHQARRYNRPLSLIVMDVDFFKAVNDTGGHQAGDDLLKCVAETIEQACRKADLPARFGGDEFAILLPETGVAHAATVAERIREVLAATDHPVSGIDINVTASIGLADLNAAAIDSPRAMLALADRALYAAKEAGRNCIVRADELDELDHGGHNPKVTTIYKKLAGLDNQFKSLFLQAIEEIMEIIEQRNPHMADHAEKVQHYSVLLAKEMELPDRVIKRVEIAAMLHDIGMLAMPDSVLLCPHELDENQTELMRKHPLYSVRIMEGMEFLEQEIPAVRYHHERVDGKGYPEGLSGASIPLTALILSVADVFDAMTSSRSYRGAKSRSEALVELRALVGTQFDGAVVDAFCNLAERMGDDLMVLPSSASDDDDAIDAVETDATPQTVDSPSPETTLAAQGELSDILK